MGAEDHEASGRHLVEVLGEDRTQLAQPFDHVAVVHDLVAYVDGRAVSLERELDDLDRAIDTRTEAPGTGQ